MYIQSEHQCHFRKSNYDVLDNEIFLTFPPFLHNLLHKRYASHNFVPKYRIYQNDWSGFEVDYIHKYGEQNYKYSKTCQVDHLHKVTTC